MVEVTTELTPQQLYRNRKKLQGICVYCVKPAEQGVLACSDHRKKRPTPEAKAKRNARRRARKREDPAWAMADRLRKRIGRAIRDYAPGMKAYKTQQYLGCTMDEFMSYMESLFVDGMSWDNRHLFHIDHIKPCVLFDLTDPEQQKACFHYTNMQPLWAIDNMIKHDTYETILP